MKRGRMKSIVAITLLLALGTGCGAVRDSLEKQSFEGYGRRTGRGSESINGTQTLGKLFETAGHKVRSWRYLSPSLEEADVIVWAPDDTKLPSIETIDWLGDWLQYSDGEKTLIYIGRDWEAAPTYWSSTMAKAPANQKAEFNTRLAEANTSQNNRTSQVPSPAECDWFAIERGKAGVKKRVDVNGLTGPWAAGVDGSKTGIQHWSAMDPNYDTTTLLADSAGHPLASEFVFDASEVDWTNNDSRLILIENGSFLLNAAMVNHEHRKIAGHLVASINKNSTSSQPKRVVFLEGGASPPIRENDPDNRPPTGLKLFAVWPIGAVLAQVAVLGIVFALARWPIFGLPRRLEQPSLTDFGRHVQALARLLATTRDRAYAYAQLKTYFQFDDRDKPK